VLQDTLTFSKRGNCCNRIDSTEGGQLSEANENPEDNSDLRRANQLTDVACIFEQWLIDREVKLGKERSRGRSVSKENETPCRARELI